MKRYLALLVLPLAACSFAPITISVDDFLIGTGSSSSDICYTQVTEPISVDFASVVYEGDATYTPGVGIGDNSTVELAIYGRATDPNPALSAQVKCVTRSSADTILAEDIVLEADTPRRISVGGAELADLVTQDSYWMGASLSDGAIISFPGEITFTNGFVKANF